MGWFLSERRGRKQGWLEESLASISAPPPPLLALVIIVLVLILFSSYTSYKSKMERTRVGLNIFLLFLPLLLIFLAHFFVRYGSFLSLSPVTKARRVVDQPQGAASPWGVAVFLGLMLILLSYQSSFQSMWWPHWRSY